MCGCVCVHVCMCACVCVHVCVCSMNVCFYVWGHVGMSWIHDVG